MAGGDTRLPLLPLTDIVHFPRTELKLHVLDPSYSQLVHDLAELDEESRWIGIVLMKPGPRLDREGRPEIFPAGTAARVMDLETAPDGHADLLVYGELRFELEHEIAGPYRQAVVRPVEEPWLNERDAGIVAVRQTIVRLLRALSEEMGDKLQLDVDGLASRDCAFEELINRIATRVDVPAVRKLQLLTESLPERGLSVLSILRSRKQVFDLLRPFRRRGTDPERN
ncbi:MAG TPA: LON peptidase substrate-binding domain-containing protein [Thermoanaerobaculia bacterium]|nr:LON peptidase substrate-binding domain-containing protein [Thermoanaerobaculia bacterium]